MIDVLDDGCHTEMTIYPSPPEILLPLHRCLFFTSIRTTNVACQWLYSGVPLFNFGARGACGPADDIFVRSRYPRFVVALTDLGSVAVEHQRRQMDNSGSSGHRRLTTSSLPVSFASRRGHSLRLRSTPIRTQLASNCPSFTLGRTSILTIILFHFAS